MTRKGNPVAAVLVALATGGVIVFLVERLADQLNPSDGTATMPMTTDQIKAALEAGEVPFATLLLVLGGWLLGAYAGGRVASRIGGPGVPVLAFAAIFTAVIISVLLSAPHPLWMWIGGAVGAPILAIGAAGDSITIRG